jgi:CubicO group peptidase (beta-lactamase class C family)
MKRLLLSFWIVLTLPGCIFVLRHVSQQVRKDSASTPIVAGSVGKVPPRVRTEVEHIVRGGVPGVTAIAMKDGKLLFRLDVGKINSDTQYPVASASKWMTAALVMTVVDEGRLTLDEPIARVLPEFKGEAGHVTLRELLAQTSGEGSLKSLVDIRQDPRISLADSAAAIAQRPLEDPPGKVFKYGGPGFQVAGALVEQVTGKRWADLFHERVAMPLGMSHTYWIHLPDRGVAAAQTRNPLLQGGVVTTAEDYMKFLTLIAQMGAFDGRRILSAQSVATMETVQTLGRPMGYVPPGMKIPLQYALGNWCATWASDGRCELALSPGAYGTFPWIDRASGVYGIFFLRGRLPKVEGDLRRAMAAVIAAY